MFIAKYDANGELAWAAKAGKGTGTYDSNSKAANSIAIEGAGNLLVAGTTYFETNLREPVVATFGTAGLPGSAGAKIFVAKLGAKSSPPQPVITFDPANQTVFAETSASLTSFATGLSPIRFQWQFNGSGLPRATNSWLTLSNVTTSMAGNYAVVVSNSTGSATSATATLTVNVVAPAITAHPVSRSVEEGVDVSFSVASTGIPRPSYQWRKDGQALPGATNGTLSLYSVSPQQAGRYSVVVSNQVGSVVSTEAELTVAPRDVPVPEFQWATRAGGAGGDYGRAVTVDNEGNTIVTGTFSGQASFGTNTLTSAGTDDLFVAKCDRAGKWLWARRAGGTSDDSATAVAADANGNGFVTGAFAGSASFGAAMLTSCGDHDVFLAKYDPTGKVLWAIRDGADKDDFATDIAVDAAGDVYVTGRFGGYWVPAGTKIKDVSLSKYDANGRGLWGRQTDGIDPRVAVDSSGKVYVGGTFSGMATFINSMLQSAGQTDIFVAQFDSAGNLNWVKQAGGSDFDTLEGLATDGVGNAYLTGNFFSAARYNSGTAFDAQLLSGSERDIFVTQLSPPGAAPTVPQITTQLASQTVLAGANVQVPGLFTGNATFGNTSFLGAGTNAAWVTKLDADGNFLWAKRGNTTFQVGYFGFRSSILPRPSIAADSSGNAYLAGLFESAATFGTAALNASESIDVFLVTLPAEPPQPRQCFFINPKARPFRRDHPLNSPSPRALPPH